MRLYLKKNSGYTWMQNSLGAFKGYFQYLHDTTVYRGEAALAEFSRVGSFTDFVSFLQSIDGVFSVILCRREITMFAVDCSRSMPLYYVVDGSAISDDSEALREILNIPREAVEISSAIEMYLTRFVSGEHTIYTQIHQLNGGTAGCLSPDGFSRETYYYHYAFCDTEDIAVLKHRLTNAAEAAFRRILTAVGDRPIVLSMSGGYDSRFVGCMLKRCGAKNVSCYTYGKANSFEVQQSKKNAEALGFRWTCVEYTDERILDILSEDSSSYFKYCTGHDYIIYLQNYAAVKHLHLSGWFHPDSVFMTGLCGDMPTGNYILPEQHPSVNLYDTAACVAYLYQTAYQNYKIQPPYSQMLYDRFQSRLSALPFEVVDYQSFWSAVDCIQTLNVHSRAFLHMNRVHEFFGYEWLLPYWDVNLLNAWYSVPASLRAGQKFYEDWLLNDICAPYGLGTKKVRVAYSRNPALENLMRSAGAVLAWCALRANIPLRRRVDINNFSALEGPLFHKLSDRGGIDYRHASFMLLLNRYVMERRYGRDTVHEVCQRIGKSLY